MALLLIPLRQYIPFLPNQWGERTMFGFAYYLGGYVCSKHIRLTQETSPRGIWLLLIPAVAAPFVQWSVIGHKSYPQLLGYLVCSASGIWGILHLSAILSRSATIVRVLSYVGARTLYILTFHFVGFKPLSALYLWANHLPMTCLSEFPVLQGMPSVFWIAYAAVSLLFCLGMHRLIGRYL